MNAFISPYRIVAEDLEGLDKKTREGLAPLLDALNQTIQQLVASSQSSPASQTVSTLFNTDGTGNAYVDVTPKLATKAYSAEVNQMRRQDSTPITSVWSWSWDWASENVRLLFIGLDMSAQYSLTVTLR